MFRYRLRTLVLLTVLGPPVLAVALGEEPQGDAAKKELDKVQGKWLLVFWRFDGKDLDAAKELGTVGDKTTITFTANAYVVKVGDKVYEEGTASFDPTILPPTFNSSTVTIAAQPQVSSRPGIYLLKDNLFIACVNFGRKKPTTFSAEAGENQEIVIYRRLIK